MDAVATEAKPAPEPSRRRGLVVTSVLVVFAVVAGACSGAAIVSDYQIRQTPTRAQFEQLESKLGAAQRQLKQQQNQLGPLTNPNILSLPTPDGTVTVTYDDQEGIDVGRLQTYLDHYYPILSGVMGKAWQNLAVDIRIDRYQSVPAELRIANCQPGLSQADMTFKTVAAVQSNVLTELAHAFDGCYSLSDARFEDGIAGAASALALAGPLPPVTPDTNAGPTISNVGLTPISVFAAYERTHRGFIARFRLAVYQRLCDDAESDSPCLNQAVPPPQLWEVAERVSPGFTAWFGEHGVTAVGST